MRQVPEVLNCLVRGDASVALCSEFFYYERSVGRAQSGDLMSVLIMDWVCQAGMVFARPSLKTRS